MNLVLNSVFQPIIRPIDAAATTAAASIEATPWTASPELDIADRGVWTYFNEPHGIVLDSGNLLVGSVNETGQFIVSHYDIATDEATQIVMSGAVEEDDHNNPAMVRLGNGMILVVYSKHGKDLSLRYRISNTAEPTTAGDFEAEQVYNTSTAQSYFSLFEVGGQLYCLQRGRAAGKKWGIVEFNQITEVFENPVWIMNGPTGDDNAYLRMAPDAANARMWFMGNDGSVAQNYESSLYSFYMAAGSFFNPDGTLIKLVAAAPINSPGDFASTAEAYAYFEAPATSAPFDEGIAHGLPWSIDCAVDSAGVPWLAFVVTDFRDDPVSGGHWRESSQRVQGYLARFTGGAWAMQRIANLGWGMSSKSPRYPGGMAFDPADPETIYISSNNISPFNLSSYSGSGLASNFEIYKGTWNGAAYDWAALTSDSDDPFENGNGSTGATRPAIFSGGGKTYMAYLRGFYEWWDATLYSTRVVVQDVS